MIGAGPGATKEQDLSWEDWSLPVDLSHDGKTLLFDEQGEGRTHLHCGHAQHQRIPADPPGGRDGGRLLSRR